MSKPFKGVVNIDVRDSIPDWEPYEQPNAPDGAPNLGLNIGRDGASPVTWDCPGDSPWAFTGGTIERVVVDVSGEPYLDLEKEAMAVLSRE